MSQAQHSRMPGTPRGSNLGNTAPQLQGPCLVSAETNLCATTLLATLQAPSQSLQAVHCWEPQGPRLSP